MTEDNKQALAGVASELNAELGFSSEIEKNSDFVNKIDDGSWIEGFTDNEPVLEVILDYVKKHGFKPKPETFDKFIDDYQGGGWRWSMDLYFLET